MSSSDTQPKRPIAPFLVAHRAGNDLGRLRDAEHQGVRMIEADVQIRRGRPEVRHARRLGLLPVYWDEGRLDATRRKTMLLDDLLTSLSPATELLLDLKGGDRRLSERVLGAVSRFAGERRISVCARRWELLEPFGEEERVPTLYSVGTQPELAAFLARRREQRAAGVSIRESLVDHSVIARLRAAADVVLCWTVNCPSRARRLAGLGVDGLTTDDVSLLRAAVEQAPAELSVAA